MVRLAGLEPVRLSAPDPKSGASTNFATGATNGRTHSAIPGSGVQDYTGVFTFDALMGSTCGENP